MPEVARVGVEPEHVAQVAAEHARRLRPSLAPGASTSTAWSRMSGRRRSRVEQTRRSRAGWHPCAARPPAASRRSRRAAGRRRRTARRCGSERIHASSCARCSGFSRTSGQRHLVRAPRSLDGQTVDDLRAGPPLRRAQHDHRPARPAVLAAVDARASLDRADLAEHVVERRGELLVHERGIVARDEVRLPAAAGRGGRRARPRGCARARWGSRSCTR